MRRLAFATLLIACASAVPVAHAQAPATPGPETPREMLEDASRKALKALELMLKAIPQYEAPEILDNGDIIIRRKRVKPDGPAPDDSGPTKTKT